VPLADETKKKKGTGIHNSKTHRKSQNTAI